MPKHQNAHDVVTLADCVQFDTMPVRASTRAAGRYGQRQPVDIGIKLTSRFVNGKNAWRRVYNDGRLYIWLNGHAVYHDAAVSERVVDSLLNDGT